MIGIVLLQRSDGSALGLGGGGGGGGFMSGAGAADTLTRTTSVLAALFFATSLGLAVFAQPQQSETELLEELTGEEIIDPTAPASAEDLLRTLGGARDDASDDAPGGASTEPAASPAETTAPVDEVVVDEAGVDEAVVDDAAVEMGASGSDDGGEEPPQR